MSMEEAVFPPGAVPAYEGVLAALRTLTTEDEVYAVWLNILGTDEALDCTFAAPFIAADLDLMHSASEASHRETPWSA